MHVTVRMCALSMKPIVTHRSHQAEWAFRGAASLTVQPPHLMRPCIAYFVILMCICVPQLLDLSHHTKLSDTAVGTFIGNLTSLHTLKLTGCADVTLTALQTLAHDRIKAFPYIEAVVSETGMRARVCDLVGLSSLSRCCWNYRKLSWCSSGDELS